MFVNGQNTLGKKDKSYILDLLNEVCNVCKKYATLLSEQTVLNADNTMR